MCIADYIMWCISLHSYSFLVENNGALGKKTQCRICHEDDFVKNMEAPCSCDGSFKFAHKKCIQKWCNEKKDTTSDMSSDFIMEKRRADAGNDMISINILTLDSQRYLLRVPKQMLVSQLKEEIALPTGIPREQQHLVYCGEFLNDNRTLSDHNIQNGHTLHVITQPPNAASSSHNLNPPAPVSEDQAPFNTHFHGQGNTDYATQIISALVSGFAVNFANNPVIRPENPLVIVCLLSDLRFLRIRSSQRNGEGIRVAMAPSQHPLLSVLHSTNSLLTTLARSVYPQPQAESFLFQLERRGSWRRRRNNGASSYNSNNNAAGTSSQYADASVFVEERGRHVSVRPRDPRLNRRRRRDDE